jgi:hypothetical protein
MFIHPQCPCSRASLNELATLLARCPGEVETQVMFFQPPNASEDWAHTDLWRSAEQIPGVITRLDPGGVEQERFGARASGEAFLYEPDGKLLFHGGITAGRGHAGDNAGRATLEAILLKQHQTEAETPVFGCELQASCTLPKSAPKISTRRDP